jgi:dTDP-4-amino-4,6-dideoxygalactose transaminase
VLAVLDSGWLTTGPKAKEFEEAFANFVGSAHAVAVNSATAALHLALDALGVGPADEVIVPTWTFAATAEVVAYRGATPVLVDSEPSTLNASTTTIMSAVTPRTRAVIVVHFAGLPIDIEGLVGELDPRGIPTVEDAAHAFPSRFPATGRFAGTIGRVGAYSFYVTKTMTTGEGGMLVTDDQSIAERARIMSLHGISRDAWKRYSESGSWYYEIEDAGYKYNLTDIAAALGLVQLARSHELHESRRRLATLYGQYLRESGISDLLELPSGVDDARHAWHLYVVRLRLEGLTCDRAAIIEGLRLRGIGTSVHFIPLHLHPYYRRRWGTTPQQFPVATREYERVISLPLWPGMSNQDLERVVGALESVIGASRRRARFSARPGPPSRCSSRG